MIGFKTAFVVLVLAWYCLGVPPPNIKATRRSLASDSNLDLNSSAAYAQNLLSKVTVFMKKLSDLTNDMESLTPTEALTLLPEFVQEAVKLRGELDSNPVKFEDPEAVERVKDLVTSSLHSFAKKFDGKQSTTTTIVDLEYAEDATEMSPETSTDEYEPEVTTVLAPAEVDARTENKPSEDTKEDQKDQVMEEEPKYQGNQVAPPTPPVKFRPITVPFFSHPFANTEAFAFSNPVTNHIQGPAPVIRWLPGGGYYVYYNQG